MKNNQINWDELRQKVDEDLQNDIDEEIAIIKNIREKEGNDGGIINLKDYGIEDSEEDQNYEDEGGELPELSNKDISRIAWNNAEKFSPFWSSFSDDKIQMKEYSLECKHLQNKDYDSDEVYIYPIDDEQELCLCKQCNMILASKMLEQLALETFIF